MSSVTPELIQKLREKTGTGFLDCKNALVQCSGDIEKAYIMLREKGKATAEEKSSKTTKEGTISSYVHLGGKLGVLVELNCETDFVAKTPEFQQLAKDIAMQIAAVNPLAVKREDLSEELIKIEKEIYSKQVKDEGKPEKIIDKIIQGKLEKYYATVCLLDQSYVKEPSITVKNIIEQAIAKFGENIVIKRFVRFKIGEVA